MGSPGQLAQVVQNLVSNALRAVPPGTPGAVVTVRLGADEAGRATLEVVDTGVGIAPEVLGRVFEPFFTTRPAGEGRGTGLGLSVCHSIVTAHEGTITVESQVGKGSTFQVRLPAAPDAPRADPVTA
ncbi:MAG TPA: HAMP domain-containing sensor histidine kinase [Anaeromyxobacteraceae bacterium]|nr:HAMP domain-containing sensor histidine kinase [Anaeromyxobacteraceae bacterium]